MTTLWRVLVAIDGPAGAGKSTVARRVAAALGFTYLDTGAMYRAAALTWPDSGAEIGFDDAGHVLLGGRDVSGEIRTPEISARASEIAALPAVRERLIARQRELIAAGDYVAEGRDIATVVAPGAEVKVFLTASAAERALRRAADLGSADIAAVAADLTARDARDQGHGRTTSEPAPGAVVLDTTGMTVDAVVAQIVDWARDAR